MLMLKQLFSLVVLASAAAGSVLSLPKQLPIGSSPSSVLPPDSWSYEDCGNESDPVSITSISVSPDPPKIGQDLTVSVAFEVTQLVEEGAFADVLVKVGRIKLLNQRFDLCEEGRKANASVSCPVEPGNYVITQTVELPKETPKLRYVINVQGWTKAEKALACVDLGVYFRPFFQVWD
ncbi:unnamed protein product [Mycena citricolor]|uniref:Phosphatidylglycerol/phosphatidylinositol transfer protein n=1 Tax=Mycena citricolor TaxID=2018698 RepID=A0AAD2H6M9_9AGAR|nr:unnamed protein product [Mycena citricolor]